MEVTSLRGKLYETQDIVMERDDKIRTLENHINELLEQRDADDKTIRMLKENNTSLVEEESRVRESLDLMKKVFTRAQMKAKADQETIALLREERDSVQRSMADLEGRATKSTFDKAAVQRIKQAADENEKHLRTLLQQSEKEAVGWKKKHAIAERTVKNLRDQLGAMKNPDKASRQLKKQRELIDQLEQQINDLEMDELEREIELRDDELLSSNDIVHRGCFDEDLDQSLTRKLIRKMDCGGIRHM